MSRNHGAFNQMEAETLDLALMIHAEHGGGNNSAFANVVVASTGTDIYSAMTASLGSLKGPRHGGANGAVEDMMTEVINAVGVNATDDELREVFIFLAGNEKEKTEIATREIIIFGLKNYALGIQQ